MLGYIDFMFEVEASLTNKHASTCNPLFRVDSPLNSLKILNGKGVAYHLVWKFFRFLVWSYQILTSLIVLNLKSKRCETIIFYSGIFQIKVAQVTCEVHNITYYYYYWSLLILVIVLILYILGQMNVAKIST